MSIAQQAQQLVTTGNLLLAMPVAAAAGFISFASPCVLPLVPGYLSYVSGVSGQDVERGGRQLGRVLGGVALFVLGFSLVFVALGAALGALSSWLLANRGHISQIAGVVVIVMGLFLAGVIRPKALYRERRLRADKVPGGLAGALPLGMVFGLGVPFLIAALGFRGAVGRFPALRRRFRLFELAGGGMLVIIGLLLVTGLWDSFINHIRVWSGSVNLPL